MDDTTIIIKQNRCFKEVIKEIELYEQATEAKINYDKTKGLWSGSWKGRRTSPMNIKWTSGDVANLGIYFGNDEPAKKTIEEIVPNFKKRLSYWKQFSLSKIGKARVAEMFLASKLVYAIKFYPIPINSQSDIQNSIFNFINFPMKGITIGQREMWKIKENGGCKLVNIQVKSAISKAKWLMEIASNPNFKVNLDIFSDLVGVQKGNNRGKDLIFMIKPHIERVLKINSPFYKEALKAISAFQRKKGIPSSTDWDKENIFYNPLITNKQGKILKETEYFRRNEIFTLGHLLNEKSKESQNLSYDKKLVSLANNIILDIEVKKDDMVSLGNKTETKMAMITQKQLYKDAILKNSRDHIHQSKWAFKLQTLILWDEVWNSVHHFLLSNTTKTAIWEQIHLNFYTQYTYNKWHGSTDVCPLCKNIPESIYHTIMHCEFVDTLWTQITPTLIKLHDKSVDDLEKAFGIVNIKKSNGMILRNWITYKMRELILQFERKAYHSSKIPSMDIFKAKLNQSISVELQKWMHIYNNQHKLHIFEKIFAYKNILCLKIKEGEYHVKKVI